MKWSQLVPEFIQTHWYTWWNKTQSFLESLGKNPLKNFNTKFIKKGQPLVLVVALIMSLFLIGVVMGSFLTLFASLLLLYFIFTRVFGINVANNNVVVV